MASRRITGFLWYMLWIVFLLVMDLYCIALPTPRVKYYNKVDVCPNNETEWKKASKRLNCTDTANNTTNRYHCLPVYDLSTLMEFCYNERRPRITSGLCIAYVPEKNALNSHNCTTFDYGCPDSNYFSDETYAFPNCSNINPIDRCYVADSSCPPTPANERKTTESAFRSLVIVLYVFLILFVAGIVGLILYTNRKGKKEDGKTKVGEKKLRKFLSKEKIDISHIRCIIVGCARAGKTTFLKRLENTQFEKLKNDVKSTEMADIYVNMFEVSEDRETIESVKNKSPTVIFSPNMVHNKTTATQQMQVSENQTDINDEDMPPSEFEVKDSYRNKDNTDTKLNRSMMELSTIEFTDTSSTHSHEKTPLMNGENYSLQNRTNSKDCVSNYGNNNDEDYAMSKIMEALEQLNTNPRPRITFIDFAGQSIYYAFHQIYLSPKTCYILVVDMTKGHDEKVDTDETVASRFVSWTYKDYYKFWLKSIDSFSDPNAQVIVVGTHADETQTEERNKFFKELFAACFSRDLRRHLHARRCFTIGFPKPGSELEDLGDIKKCIASLVHDPESIRPVWAIFEQIFEKHKKQKIISRKMLSMWNNTLSKDLHMKDNEISEMLFFFHRVGMLLYFEEDNLKETIILDIQWFSDAFKCIISYHVDIKNTDIEHEHFQNTGELDDPILEKIWRMEEKKEYSENKDIILAYMEQLGLLAICNTKCPDTKEIQTWYYIPSMNKRKFEINDKKFTRSSILCFQFNINRQLPIFVFYGAIVKCMKIPGWSIFIQNGKKCIYENVACFSYQNLLVKICQCTFQIQVQVCFPPGKVIDRELRNIQISIEEILREFKSYSFQVGYKCINEKFNVEDDNSFISMEKFPDPGLCGMCNEVHEVKNDICWIKPLRPVVQHALPSAIKEEIRKSVGLIYICGRQRGMGFRVGEKYILTCAHVVQSLMSGSPNTINPDQISIEFEEEKHTKKVNSSTVFGFRPSIVYFDKEYDFSVLELVPHEVGTLFPPPVTHFSEVVATGIHLVGRLDGKHIKVESGLMPKWLPEHKDDIEGLFKKEGTDSLDKGKLDMLLETPRKIIVQSTLERMYSGTPGVMILDGKPCIVLMIVGKMSLPTGDVVGVGIAMSDIRTKMINSESKWDKDFASSFFPEWNMGGHAM